MLQTLGLWKFGKPRRLPKNTLLDCKQVLTQRRKRIGKSRRSCHRHMTWSTNNARCSCVVWTERELTAEAIEKLNAIKDLTIQQQTPVRVLHRRTLMTRPKIIHDASCEVLNKHYMLLRLTTSAGTYVKEFVHGDRGRTQPNVSSILVIDKVDMLMVLSCN